MPATDSEITDLILVDAANRGRFVTKEKARELVGSLRGIFSEGTTVCLHLPNDVLYPVLVLAIMASKCRWLGTNTAYKRDELKHQLNVSQARYVITLPEHLETVESATQALGWDVGIWLFTDLLQPQEPGETAYPVLHHLVEDSKAKRNRSPIGDLLSDIAMLQSTSGTTGMPKMAARTHLAMMLEAKAIEDINAAKPYKVRRLFGTPIFHAFSTPEMLINPLRLGYTTYIMRRSDGTLAQKIHDFQITETACAPPMIMRLTEQKQNHHLLQSLRLVFSGGAPLAAEARKQFLSIFKHSPRIVQVYGMTEGGWFTTFKHPEDDVTGAVGRLLPGYEAIVDVQEVTQTAGEKLVGELLVRSPQLMSCYFGDQQATKEAFVMMAGRAWLKTGDIGYMEDGKVYILDRTKDLIKVNGFSVSPVELEAALLSSPDVRDAAAVSAGTGVDEHPLMFVVLSHDDVKAEDLREHMLARLARYKVASIEFEPVNEIPRNPSGKVLRRKLREQATLAERSNGIAS